VFGNENSITFNRHNENSLSRTEVNRDNYNRFINKRKDSNITYRQSPENTTRYDIQTMELREALAKGIAISWLKYHSTGISNTTRDPDINCRLFLEQNSDIGNEAKQYALEEGKLDLLKYLTKYGVKLGEIDLNIAGNNGNEKMAEYIQNILDNQNG